MSWLRAMIWSVSSCRYSIARMACSVPLMPSQRLSAQMNGFLQQRSASGSRREGWALEHARPVLDEQGAAVEGAVVDHVERDVGIAVVDAFRAGGTCDHGEHHDPEAIDDPGAQQ